MIKNLIEIGFPGLSNGVNPHSYTETFSLSGAVSPKAYEAIQITLANTMLITTAIKICGYIMFITDNLVKYVLFFRSLITCQGEYDGTHHGY